MPVEAASRMPIRTTVSASPPRSRPNTRTKFVIIMIGDARAIEHQAHVYEHGKRHEHPVRHLGEDAVDNDGEVLPAIEQERIDAEVLIKKDAERGEDQR